MAGTQDDDTTGQDRRTKDILAAISERVLVTALAALGAVGLWGLDIIFSRLDGLADSHIRAGENIAVLLGNVTELRADISALQLADDRLEERVDTCDQDTATLRAVQDQLH